MWSALSLLPTTCHSLSLSTPTADAARAMPSSLLARPPARSPTAMLAAQVRTRAPLAHGKRRPGSLRGGLRAVASDGSTSSTSTATSTSSSPSPSPSDAPMAQLVEDLTTENGDWIMEDGELKHYRSLPREEVMASYSSLKTRLLTNSAIVGVALTAYCTVTTPTPGAPLGVLLGSLGSLYYLVDLSSDIEKLQPGPSTNVPVVAAKEIEDVLPRLAALIPALYAQALGSRRVWIPLAITLLATAWNYVVQDNLPHAGFAPALIGFGLGYKMPMLLVGWDDLKESMMDEERGKILSSRQRPTLVEPEDSGFDIYGNPIDKRR